MRTPRLLCFGFAILFIGDLGFKDKHDKAESQGNKTNIINLADTVPTKKDTSSSSPMIDFRGAEFYGPVAIGPNATQINNFRGSNEFAPMPLAKFEQVVNNLRLLKNNHPGMPEIQLTNLSGSIATISAMDELKSLLDSAGITVEEVQPNGTMDYGNSGIWSFKGSKDSAMVNEFSIAIWPFMTVKKVLFDPYPHGQHSFRIFFCGPAKYESSGEVAIY